MSSRDNSKHRLQTPVSREGSLTPSSEGDSQSTVTSSRRERSLKLWEDVIRRHLDEPDPPIASTDYFEDVHPVQGCRRNAASFFKDVHRDTREKKVAKNDQKSSSKSTCSSVECNDDEDEDDGVSNVVKAALEYGQAHGVVFTDGNSYWMKRVYKKVANRSPTPYPKRSKKRKAKTSRKVRSKKLKKSRKDESDEEYTYNSSKKRS